MFGKLKRSLMKMALQETQNDDSNHALPSKLFQVSPRDREALTVSCDVPGITNVRTLKLKYGRRIHTKGEEQSGKAAQKKRYHRGSSRMKEDFVTR
ncbi:hypothetical protein STEG23_035419 [Scotinomys teguina]